LWQELLRNKYLKDKTLEGCTKRPIDSHFWKVWWMSKTLSWVLVHSK
jgi:hypothetical protein